MNYRFQFRRYRLPFRVPVRTAHGLWAEREGVIVRLEAKSETGNQRPEQPEGDSNLSAFRSPVSGLGFGEAAPIPWFGTETVDEIDAACRELGEWVDGERLAKVPTALGCLKNAIAAAERDATRGPGAATEPRGDAGQAPAAPAPYLAIAALLPAGRAALPLVAEKAESGFRVFKWKMGVADLADELALLDDLCAALPSGAKLRLDANGAWDRRRAARCLERCAERPVEFVEQPCFAEAAQGARERAKVEDVLLGLANDYPTPLALDESLVGEGDLERWLGAGWPGVFVVKPLLLGDPPAALARLAAAKARVVFSSALETAVGARRALRLAWDWPGERLALGFGVWPLFADGRFDGPALAPFVRWEDVDRIRPEDLWNALS